MYKEELKKRITICKKDVHKRYIWVQIDTGHRPVYIAGCYIPHRESPFYDNFKVEKGNPFEDLYADIMEYMQKGVVMLIGDMNARIANAQMQKVDLMMHPDNAHKIDVLDSKWDRCSQDLISNQQGTALISLMTSMQLAVINGTHRFGNSGGYTCHTANKGMSTIAYVLINYEAAHIIQNFDIGDQSPNSDHTPIHVWLQIQPQETERKLQKNHGHTRCR